MNDVFAKADHRTACSLFNFARAHQLAELKGNTFLQYEVLFAAR